MSSHPTELYINSLFKLVSQIPQFESWHIRVNWQLCHNSILVFGKCIKRWEKRSKLKTRNTKLTLSVSSFWISSGRLWSWTAVSMFGPIQIARLLASILLTFELWLMWWSTQSKCLSKRRFGLGSLPATLKNQANERKKKHHLQNLLLFFIFSTVS